MKCNAENASQFACVPSPRRHRIFGGKALTDAELSEWLEASRRVVAAWRRRLRKADLIGWMMFPGQQGRVFWIGPVNKTLIFKTTTPAKPPSPEEVPQAPAGSP